MPRDSVASLIGIVRLTEDVIHSWQYFDQYTGTSLDTLLLDDMPSGERLNMLGYPIHVGSIMGLPGKITAFFTSLICASLPITGFLIWWGRRRKSERKPKTKERPKLTLIPDMKNSLAENKRLFYMDTNGKNNNPIKDESHG